MKKLVTLFFLIGFIVFIFGCDGGNSSVFVQPDSFSESQKESVTDGKLPDISFPSGAEFKVEDNALSNNVVVKFCRKY